MTHKCSCPACILDRIRAANFRRRKLGQPLLPKPDFPRLKMCPCEACANRRNITGKRRILKRTYLAVPDDRL